jgi:hypothetical protein
MNPSFREIGPGYVTGTFKRYANAGMLTTDFASAAGNAYLTGVAYDDASGDHFYTPGEGLGAVTVTATRLADGTRATATTWGSGGYSLALPAGTYKVTGSGGRLGGTITFGSVTIGSQNVKEDFVAGAAVTTPPPPTTFPPPGRTDTTAPKATLTRARRLRVAAKYHAFTVTFADAVAAVDPATLGNDDIVVTGPHGFSRAAIFVSADTRSGAGSVVATYKVKGPGNRFDPADDGTYTIALRAARVADTRGNAGAAAAAAKVLGTFKVIIPAPAPMGVIAALVAPATAGAKHDDVGDAVWA